MDETLVDHGNRRPGDPADRADLAGDAARDRTGQADRTEQATRELYRRGRAAPARGDRRPLSETAPASRRALVRGQGLGAAAAPARDAGRWRGAGGARCWSRRPARARRWPGFLPTICELAEQPSRGPAHALRLAAEGAGGRRPAQPASARSRRWACRSGSRRAPATRRPTARRGSGCKPPQILLTTPESLSLLLSYPDSVAHVREPEDDRRRRAPRLRQGQARRPAVAVDGAAAGARAGPAPRRPVGDDQRSRRLSRLARAGCRHGAGRPRPRRSRRRARPLDPDPREPASPGRGHSRPPRGRAR